jgi:hypothetical protein
MRTTLFALGLVASGLPLTHVPVLSANRPETITLGRLTLTACERPDGDAYCGSLERPLDPDGAIEGSVDIGIEWWPRYADEDKSAGVLAAFEGGPGFPSTGSASYYLPLFEPLRQTRDVLFVDQRGTGKSGLLSCPDLQAARRLP